MRNSNEFIRIESLAVQPGYRMLLKFSDEVTRIIDYSRYLLNDEMSGPLKEESLFSQVRIKRNGRVLEWPNGYDADADWLHSIPALDEFSDSASNIAESVTKKLSVTGKPQMQLLQQFENLSDEEQKEFLKLLHQRYPEIGKAS